MISSAIAYYRQHPVLGIFLAAVALVLALGVVVLGNGRPVLAIAFTMVMGLVIGVAIAAAQRAMDGPE